MANVFGSADVPMHVSMFDTVELLKNYPHPEGRGHLIVRYADAFTFKVGRALDLRLIVHVQVEPQKSFEQKDRQSTPPPS